MLSHQRHCPYTLDELMCPGTGIRCFLATQCRHNSCHQCLIDAGSRWSRWQRRHGGIRHATRAEFLLHVLPCLERWWSNAIRSDLLPHPCPLMLGYCLLQLLCSVSGGGALGGRGGMIHSKGQCIPHELFPLPISGFCNASFHLPLSLMRSAPAHHSLVAAPTRAIWAAG